MVKKLTREEEYERSSRMMEAEALAQEREDKYGRPQEGMPRYEIILTDTMLEDLIDMRYRYGDSAACDMLGMLLQYMYGPEYVAYTPVQPDNERRYGDYMEDLRDILKGAEIRQIRTV